MEAGECGEHRHSCLGSPKYLIWPFVVLWLPTGKLRKVCWVAIVGGFVFRTGLLLELGGNADLAAVVALPSQIDALAVGALLAVVVREQESLAAALAWPAALIGAAIWMASLLDGRAVLTAGMSGFSMMSVGLLALCLFHPISKLFAAPVLRSLGKYSYGIYVLHVIILPFLWPLRDKMGIFRFGFMFGFIPISYCAGWLSWHLFEKHFLSLKRFFPATKDAGWRPSAVLQRARQPIPIPLT